MTGVICVYQQSPSVVSPSLWRVGSYMAEFRAELVLPTATVFTLSAYIAGLVFAWLEIEIEGAYAWSRDNPHTWRWESGICGNGLPLTGYHLTMFATILLVTMGTLAMDHAMSNRPVQWSSLLSGLAYYFYVVLLEDYEWYVYNQEFKALKSIGRARAPFGTIWNRYGRYVLNLCVFAPCWILSFGVRPSDDPTFDALTNADDAGVRILHGSYILAFVFIFTGLLLAAERFTLLPLYDLVRHYLVAHDKARKEMHYELVPEIVKTSMDPPRRERITYYAVPDRDNMDSFAGSTKATPMEVDGGAMPLFAMRG